MRLLLDTHTFLWFISGDSKLSDHARKLIESNQNERLLSIASLWEMSIKASIGKIKLNMTFQEMNHVHIEGNAIQVLHITPKHLDILSTLPFYHKDPFDRLIIVQGQSEMLSIVSKDNNFKDYTNIKVIW